MKILTIKKGPNALAGILSVLTSVSDPDDGSGDWISLTARKMALWKEPAGTLKITVLKRYGPLTRMMTFKRIGFQRNL